MPSQSRFLGLPRELRDIIYEYYVLDEGGGYHFDHSSCKFRASNGQPINLALMYTCKSVAADMHGLALRTNSLIFSTMCLGGEDSRAIDFHWALNGLRNEKGQQLSVAQRHITSDIEDEVTCKYPSFVNIFNNRGLPFNRVGEGREISCWGETYSVYWGFVDHTLALFWHHKQSEFLEALKPMFLEVDPSRLAQLLALKPVSWAIPSKDEVTEMQSIVRFPHSQFFNKKDKYFQTKRIKHRFSAAAVAIRFFESVSPNILLQIRNVLLSEDRESVGYPASHAMGLVEICLAYPQLRIERRVAVWQNILPSGSDYIYSDGPNLYRIASPNENTRPEESDKLQYLDVGNSFSVWIKETLGLYDAGMPIESFSLVFDGDSDPDQSSAVFEIVKQAATWQEALDQWFKQKSLDPTFQERRQNLCYQSERFPQAVRSMVEGRSPIRCNFPIGGLWDVQHVLDENSANETLLDWEDGWEDKVYPKTFQTMSPLPSWQDLRLDKVIPAPPEEEPLSPTRLINDPVEPDSR
ncbi:hypothetical protein MMC10_000358 [Thelotrema lepadinum]|nr:hypothetical protein [Thelotrema lepadinum]